MPPKLYGKLAPTLRWAVNPEPDVVGYIVYWRTDPGPYIGSVNVGNMPVDPAYTITGLFPIQRWYYFAVTAYDAFGNESVISDELAYYVSDQYTRASRATVIARRG